VVCGGLDLTTCTYNMQLSKNACEEHIDQMRVSRGGLAVATALVGAPAVALASGNAFLSASPATLEDGQGVVIYVRNDRPPNHLDAVLASCDKTSIVERVPKRDAGDDSPFFSREHVRARGWCRHVSSATVLNTKRAVSTFDRLSPSSFVVGPFFSASLLSQCC
jgi:hypothetical protein